MSENQAGNLFTVYCLLFTGYCSRPDRMADDEHMSREQLRQI